MRTKSNTIHWAESRSLTQTTDYRIHTFISSTDSGIDKVDKLKLFRDTTIAPTKSIIIEQFPNVGCVIIPLVGGLEIKKNETTIFIEPGQYYLQSRSAKQSFLVQNPYETEHINFLEVCFDCAFKKHFTTGNFNLEDKLNGLVELETLLSPKIYLGKFTARRELLINFEEITNVYFFVISGSFELNGMLLQNRDSASFMMVESLDFESLSPESIVMLVIE
ncbi:hypothetical protein [Lacihabitans sp. CS3-21]|uniref:pirin family protein n=1 Tax=Lacihabitans sp. CS3-21 TaxID=2487332 RepID=UPI0020CE6716|nr:hypothetical protein [Lacihabitans sp. CS3-21]MCP9745352.1 hypothetical protein [Lacihabitans sp. CS3-21]